MHVFRCFQLISLTILVWFATLIVFYAQTISEKARVKARVVRSQKLTRIDSSNFRVSSDNCKQTITYPTKISCPATLHPRSSRRARYTVLNQPRVGSSYFQEALQYHTRVNSQFELDLQYGEFAYKCNQCCRPGIPNSKNLSGVPPKEYPMLACGFSAIASNNDFYKQYHRIDCSSM